MPKDWPSDNVLRIKEETSVLITEIAKLEKEIAQKEARITTIPNEVNKRIERNLLQSKIGLLKMRREQLEKLNKVN